MRSDSEDSDPEDVDVVITAKEAIRYRGLESYHISELKPVAKGLWGSTLYYREADVCDLAKRLKESKTLRDRIMKAHNQKQREKQAETRYRQVADAKAAVGEFRKKANEMVDFNVRLGSTKLPLEILEKIIEEYVDTYEPDGIRGAAITLKGLVNIAKTCPDFLIAAQKGIAYFATKLPSMPVEGDWDAFFSDPCSKSIKVSDLKAILKNHREHSSGSKTGKLVIRFFPSV